MDAFVVFLEFFLNNVIPVSVVTIASVFTYYFLQKVYRELRMNQRLRAFQRRLREKPKVKGTMRLTALSSLILLPLFTAFMFFQLNTSPQMEYHQHLTTVESSNDVIDIYNSYHSKFSSNISLRSEGVSIDEDRLYSEALLDISLQSEYKDVTTSEDSLFVSHASSIDVFTLNDLNAPLNQTLPMLDNYTVTSVDYQSTYLMVLGEHIDEEQSVLLIYTEEDETYTLKNVYRFNGIIEAYQLVGNTVSVITHHDSDFSDSEQLSSNLPSVYINEYFHQTDIDQVHYIEGTEPTRLTSMFVGDIDSNNITMNVIVGNENQAFKFTDDALFIVSPSYEFLEAAEHFIMANPVRTKYTAVSKFELNSHGINYASTKLVQGEMIENFTIDYDDGFIRFVISSEKDDRFNHHLIVVDESMTQLSKLTLRTSAENMIYNARFESGYLLTTPYEKNELASVYRFITPRVIEYMNQFEVSGFGTSLRMIDESSFISIGYYDQQMDGLLNGLVIDQYTISGYNIDKNTSTMLDYSELNYPLSASRQSNMQFVYEDGLLMLPLYTKAINQTHVDDGVLVFKLDQDNSLNFDTFITHNTTLKQIPYRLYYINDHLYTVSNEQVSVMHRDELTQPLYTYRYDE